METNEKQFVTVKAIINAPVEKVWKYWTEPEHITKWNNASPDWHSPSAQNDLRKGGQFLIRMEAKDGSMGFDFGGTYDDVIQNKKISYIMDDGRVVSIDFSSHGNSTTVTETFEAEQENPIELQKNGWQGIMDNFKRYVEENPS